MLIMDLKNEYLRAVDVAKKIEFSLPDVIMAFVLVRINFTSHNHDRGSLHLTLRPLFGTLEAFSLHTLCQRTSFFWIVLMNLQSS